MDITTIMLLIVMAALSAVTWLFVKPMKIWLCEKRICGVIVPANHVTPVFRGGSFFEWACPTGLIIKVGQLEENKNNGTLKPPGNSGDKLGIWWKGWFAWFLGYRFPRTENRHGLVIEKIRKKVGVDPQKPITEQFDRPVESIVDLRRNINRFIIVNAVELNDGSIVNIVLYAAGGVVKDPHKFWIQHGKEAFGIWESRASTALSGFLEKKSFEEIFRSSTDPYEQIEKYLNGPTRPDIKIIGVEEEVWKMEQWEDASPDKIKQEREKLAGALADQKTKQETAKQRVTTAEETSKAVEAEQKVAEKRANFMSKLAGSDTTAQTLASISLVASEVGPHGFALANSQLKINERAATPGLSVLVEGGAGINTMLQIPATQTDKPDKPEDTSKKKEGK